MLASSVLTIAAFAFLHLMMYFLSFYDFFGLVF